MVLGKLPVPGHPADLDNSRAWAYCTCSCLDIFSLIYHFSLLSPSLSETTQFRLKFCLKWPLSPNPTSQPTETSFITELDQSRPNHRIEPVWQAGIAAVAGFSRIGMLKDGSERLSNWGSIISDCSLHNSVIHILLLKLTLPQGRCSVVLCLFVLLYCSCF